MSNKLSEDDLARRDFLLRTVDNEIACAPVYKTFIIGQHVIGFLFLLATHKQHRLKKFARCTLGQYTLALMEMIKVRQLKGGFILSKCITDLVSFYRKCSFSLAEAPFSSWAERGTKIMCFELTMEDNDEKEKVPEKSAVKERAAAINHVNRKQIVAKKVKKPLREKSAFDDGMSSFLSDANDVGLAPAKKAKKEKPVQIDTSSIKVAAIIRKAPKPRAKPQLKRKTKAIVDGSGSDEVMSDGDSVESKKTTKSASRWLDKHFFSGNCGGKIISGPSKPVPIRYYTCKECDEERRYDRGSIKRLEKVSLKSALLDKLPKQTTQLQLKDNASDTNSDYASASLCPTSSKRQNTGIHMAVIEPDHIEVDIMRQLQTIEQSTESVHINALTIQDICSKFNKDLLIKLFQMTNTLMLLRHTSWVRATLTLSQIEGAKRTETLSDFKWHITNHYNDRIGIWCSTYWNYLSEDQFALLKIFKNSPSTVDDSILMISLCSAVDGDGQKYIEVVSQFVRNAPTAYGLLYDTIISCSKQMKLRFEQFIKLTDVLQDKTYAAIESIKDTRLQILVAKWKDQIELAHATSTVIDGDSIQKSLNEFIAKYGKPDPQLAADLSIAGDLRFQFFTKVVLNPPNYKQFAAAQYCIGLLKTYHRQMWCVPSGQGKGRIEHTLAVFALLLGFLKVYIFYSSKQLCDRDADEFSTYLDLVEKDQIQHCIGIDGLKVGDNELAIFDEGDAIMHSDPDKFRDFISKFLYVCFTATPDDQDHKGVDIQVLKAMTFPTFYYVLDVLERIVKFDFDLELPTIPVTEKAAEVKKLSQTGPVVVHCTSVLYDELKKLDLELVEADENLNHLILRTLGVKINDKFRVAVALTTAAIRGLDYRSSVDGIMISLLLAKSFVNKREAIQGYYRVGRFNDKCYRVAFKEVGLIDAKAEIVYKLNASKFLQALSRKTIQIKQINVTDLVDQSKKTPAAASKKTPAATGKTSPTRQDNNPTTGQIKTSYQGSMVRKRTNALVPQLLEERQGSIEQTPQPLQQQTERWPLRQHLLHTKERVL
ncbi:UNKNOWN [Stylonychia lemnae]|uniref:Uncharacterized protein n=1 Tax=Stylonychia lemnae TaxID=5949 RepID=A0A078B343_STYLE|nr:UNKNOWN [Stylonychia lemnae]|eukprot:CDW88935.1 UNKNOWN [Stylonychia lemnae]